jgi:hypothetical protein
MSQQRGQGFELDWQNKPHQKADNFSAAPQAQNDSRTLPNSYPALVPPLRPRPGLVVIQRAAKRRTLGSSVFTKDSVGIGQCRSPAGPEKKIQSLQKADTFCAAPMSAKMVISLGFWVPCQEF